MTIRRRFVCQVMIFTALCFPRVGRAQAVETRSVKIDSYPKDTKEPATVLVGDPATATLDGEFLNGQVDAARQRAERLMCLLKVDEWTCDSNRIDWVATKGAFFVLWAGKDVSGTPVVRRMLLRQNGDRPYALDLQGIGTVETKTPVYEVFLADDRRATLVSAFKSSRVENPLLGQIPAAVSQVLSPLFAISGAILRAQPPRAPAPADIIEAPPTVWITASRIVLPYQRASIAVTSRAQLAINFADLKKDVAALAATVKFDSAGKSAVGRAYADALVTVTVTTAFECAETISWNACLDKFREAFAQADTDCQVDCKPTPSPATLGGAPPPKLDPDDVEAKKAVETKFRTFVEGLPRTVITDSAFANTPLTHYSFGVMTGFVATNLSASRSRVKLDSNGKIAADPLPRQITMLGLNWSHSGYDAGSFRPLPGEVSQLFVGAIITPDIGVAGGWSYQLIRGLAFNLGAGLVFSKGLSARDQMGQQPADSTKPFALSVAPVGFLGFSVNFTGK